AYISKRPDVTVIDISLPDVSGFELMRRIRKDDPDAKIIMFSMNDDPAFVVRAVELGAQGYVSKGDDPRILLKAVRKVVAGDNFISPHLAE
ncbi:response regulator transcription factor, partial [Acinetobacter baumannii]